jgi:putative ABC transport system permease protein
MNSLLRDFRYAVRSLMKTPGAAIVAVLALGLGIGVNSSAFLMVNAIVLHPLPYPNLDRLMTVWETIPKLRSERDAIAPANFLDWKNENQSFGEIAAYQPWDVSLTSTGDPERIRACHVSASFFPLLGLKPALGRTFSNDEDETGRDGIIVVSHGFWEQRLASAPDVVGKAITLGGRTYSVAGVMTPDFDFPLATDVWAPLALTTQEKNDRSQHHLLALARLKPGVSVAQARVEMETLGRRLQQQFPDTNEGREVSVVPIRELTNNVTNRFTLILFGASLFVLVLACANVGSLQLARAASKQRQMAVQAALGAGRFRIASQILAESVIVGLLGGVLALFLASWNVDLTRRTIPPEVFKWVAGLRSMRLDTPVLLFTLAIAMLAGLLSGLPAVIHTLYQRTAGNLAEALKEGGRSPSSGPARSRLRSGLVVGEVALALVLLIGAGLMVKTFDRLVTATPGFDTKNLLNLSVTLPDAQYREPSQIRSFYDRTLRALKSVPGVLAADASGYLGTPEGLHIEGRPEPRPGEARPEVQAVSGHHFETMKLPVLEGRALSDQDGADAPRVVVISESIARHYWPGASPVGQRIQLGSVHSPWVTVIGVSGDVKEWFSGQPLPAAYVPYRQVPVRGMTLRIRTAADPKQIAKSAIAQVHSVDSNQPVFDVKTMEDSISEQTSGVRAAAMTMGTYGVIAFLLAVLGIHAVTSYTVAQRTHEIGIRMALGAAHSDVLKMMVWRGFRMAVIGLAIGTPTALLLTWLMSRVLYNVVPVDAGTFAAFICLLGLAALLAAYLPARRATKVDPMIALRSE